MSTKEEDQPFARDVRFTDDDLVVELADGRIIRAPLSAFPSLLAASRRQRDDWRLVGRGIGIHWPQIDEDILVAGLVRDHRSG